MELRDFNGIVEALKPHGGAVYAITAESDLTAQQAKESWGLRFDIKADQQLRLATALRARRLPTPTIDKPPPSVNKSAYAKLGMYQPATLVLTKDFRVLYEYVVIPGPLNLGGASPIRPRAREVLEVIKQHPSSDFASVVRKEFLIPSPLLPLPLFLFFVNGWLIAPKMMYLDEKGHVPFRSFLLPFKLFTTLAGGWWLASYHPIAGLTIAVLFVTFVYIRWGAWISEFLHIYGNNETADESHVVDLSSTPTTAEVLKTSRHTLN